MKKPDPRNILTYLSPLLKLEKMIRRSPVKLVFPFYHAVSDKPGPHLRHLYRVKSVKEFEKDLDNLLQNFSPISPGILGQKMKGRNMTGFILSFDDGLREIRDVIAPILTRKGIPAIFFLNNNFIDNKGLFYRYQASLIVDKIKETGWSDPEKGKVAEILDSKEIKNQRSLINRILEINFQDRNKLNQLAGIFEIDFHDYLMKNKPYLNTKELKDLKDMGFYLGAHSFEHLEFYDLDSRDQQNEIIKSTNDIKKRFELDYSYFAFPFTDYGISIDTLVELHSDPVKAPDATFGTAGFKKDTGIPHYQRLSMEKYIGDSERILKTEYLYYGLKKIIGRA